jgi:hypothetical protein
MVSFCYEKRLKVDYINVALFELLPKILSFSNIGWRCLLDCEKPLDELFRKPID